MPAELVIDHSVQVDVFGTSAAFARNAELEFERNQERYQFLRWGQDAFEGFKVVPPDTGIVHQVNLEYLARVVFVHSGPEGDSAYPDTLVGTDSHTTMVNGLGVLGWGVGGIEAEAAMLGQPMSMLIPQVIGFELSGALPEGATATDLVLTVTQMLREYGVVGRFVEFFGKGLSTLPLADRATIGNMSPEFGSTCAFFPIDAETLRYLEFSGRPADQIELVEAYAREQGMFHDESSEAPTYTDTLALDLGDVVPSLAGPKRPQDRVPLTDAKDMFEKALDGFLPDGPDGHDADVEGTFPASDPSADSAPGHDGHHGSAAPTTGASATAVTSRDSVTVTDEDGTTFELEHGDVVIAAITSCTNTSNPSVMIGAGILARNAVQRGLTVKPWVKTSLAPGSKVVTEYLDRAGPDRVPRGAAVPPRRLRLHDLHRQLGTAVARDQRGRHRRRSRRRLRAQRQPQLRGAHQPGREDELPRVPPLCVAYALAGTMDIDLYAEPIGQDRNGADVYLKDLWPTEREVHDLVEEAVQSDMFRKSYGEVFDGDERWQSLETPSGDRFAWDDSSTYVQNPPYFVDMQREPAAITDIEGARVLALLGDSVTTDHISPAGNIKADSPAGRYLQEHGVKPAGFNSYGSRRGNHEVMMRGTFANIRLRNELGGGRDPLPEGGVTRYLGDGSGEQMAIYDAAMKYAEQGIALVVLAGKEYGTGSSRDWAAKGTGCSACGPSSPRASSASTAPTSSAWASSPCSSRTATRRSHWA